MKIVRFKIPGACRGKGRPRFTTRGKYVKTYTDKETELYENWVKSCFLQTNQTPFSAEAQIYCEIIVYCEIPTSKPKKLKALMKENTIKPVKKPDCDNIAKSILDGLNKIAFNDDTQISTLVVKKFYTEEEPFVVVTLCDDNLKNE